MLVSRISPAPRATHSRAQLTASSPVATRPPREVEQRRALFRAGRDVEEDDLVGTFALVALGEHHRIADVAQRFELHTLHDPSPGDVEADDEPARQHRAAPQRVLVIRSP
jgi:hypothetical protein